MESRQTSLADRLKPHRWTQICLESQQRDRNVDTEISPTPASQTKLHQDFFASYRLTKQPSKRAGPTRLIHRVAFVAAKWFITQLDV